MSTQPPLMQLDDATFDALFTGSKFRDEVKMLRQLMLRTGLDESVKWNGPVYSLNGQNIVSIGAFKEHFSLWFFQGGLLSDPQKKLVNAQKGKTQAMRHWRMTSMSDIQPRLISAYVKEAIANAKQGLRIPTKTPVKKMPPLPDELRTALEKSTRLGIAFSKLTPGKQKEYAEYIGSAKQVTTRLSRITRIRPLILAGAGLNDKYKGKKP